MAPTRVLEEQNEEVYSGPSEPADGHGDRHLFLLVLAAVDLAKRDLTHRCGLCSCATYRGRGVKVANRADCPTRQDAAEFLEDLRTGRHWMAAFLDVAAVRSGLRAFSL
jgi:hypothetical protein